MPEMSAEAMFDRTANLRRLSEERFDLLVIGGGITGAGVALDAATRGLKVALVERNDWAAGTSSKSSKLVHGGLRYLNQRDYRLVYEALRERQRLRRNAPHLVHMLPFLIPLFGKGGFVDPRLAKALNWVLWLYDLTGGWRIGKFHKRIDAPVALGHLPILKPDRVQGGFIYYDAQTDDARLTLSIVKTAARYGTVAANKCAVVGIRGDLVKLVAESGNMRSGDGDKVIEVQATVVVNATGVWADESQKLFGESTSRLRPAKGVHIAIPRQYLQNDIGVVLPVRGTKRSIFVVPLGDYAYVGTTDTDYEGPLDAPLCTSEELDEVLSAVNDWVETPLSRSDVRATWAGLRPLVASESTAKTADLSRRHSVSVSRAGLITVTGGKLTTYRLMAADTVDKVMQQLGKPVGWARGRSGVRNRCRTTSLKIWGAEDFEEMTEASAHLANRYGGKAVDLIEMIKAEPSLGEPLIDGMPYVRAEALYAVRHEMALTLDDVLSRRIPARWLDTYKTAEVAESTASLIGPELGWDNAECSRQATEFKSSLAHELSVAGLGVPT